PNRDSPAGLPAIARVPNAAPKEASRGTTGEALAPRRQPLALLPPNPRIGRGAVSDRECWQTADFVANERTLKRKGADYHHGDLRRSLVEATVRLVAEHGVDGFTLRAAAKLA